MYAMQYKKYGVWKMQYLRLSLNSYLSVAAKFSENNCEIERFFTTVLKLMSQDLIWFVFSFFQNLQYFGAKALREIFHKFSFVGNY